ncbi:MAG: hypothetical protein ABSC05_15705 [Candidatus Solibacter sp.]|jgi:hypothetical protein
MSRAAKTGFVIDKLGRGHDMSGFDCGNPALNVWLQRYAWTNQQADSARTYVALEGDRVVGYYTLTTGSDRPFAAAHLPASPSIPPHRREQLQPHASRSQKRSLPLRPR